VVQDGAEFGELLGGDEVGFVDDEGVREFDLIDEEVGKGALVLVAEGEVFFLQRIPAS
jgi:hypothetical protein